MFADDLRTSITAFHLHSDQTIPSTRQTAKRIPEAVKADGLVEINRRVGLGAIEPISEPTEWVSGVVMERKKRSAPAMPRLVLSQ